LDNFKTLSGHTFLPHCVEQCNGVNVITASAMPKYDICTPAALVTKTATQ